MPQPADDRENAEKEVEGPPWIKRKAFEDLADIVDNAEEHPPEVKAAANDTLAGLISDVRDNQDNEKEDTPETIAYEIANANYRRKADDDSEEIPPERRGTQIEFAGVNAQDAPFTAPTTIPALAAQLSAEKASPPMPAVQAADDDFEVAVVTSRQWEAKDAGKEIAEKLKAKLKHKPKFILLFTTIHFEKHGGFQPLLDEIYKQFPEDVPLVGGTVAGFMNQDGVYTRGASAMAVWSNKMDVAVGVGENTKLNPKKAAENASKSIREKLSQSKNYNKQIFEIVAGSEIPTFPIVGNRKVINIKYFEGIISKIALFFLSMSTKYIQKGPGREEETLEYIYQELPEFSLIGGSTIDNLQIKRNFQFLNNKVKTKSLILLGVCSDIQTQIKTTFGLTPTGKKFLITQRGMDDRAIIKINGKPATQEFLRIVDLPHEILDERLYERVFHYPIVAFSENKMYPQIIGAFTGSSIAFGYKFKSNDIEIYSGSGKSLLSAVKENFAMVKPGNKTIKSIFGISCATRLETMGHKLFLERENVIKEIAEKPFLVVFTAGEDTCDKEVSAYHKYNSYNLCYFMK